MPRDDSDWLSTWAVVVVPIISTGTARLCCRIRTCVLYNECMAGACMTIFRAVQRGWQMFWSSVCSRSSLLLQWRRTYGRQIDHGIVVCRIVTVHCFDIVFELRSLVAFQPMCTYLFYLWSSFMTFSVSWRGQWIRRTLCLNKRCPLQQATFAEWTTVVHCCKEKCLYQLYYGTMSTERLVDILIAAAMLFVIS